MWIPKSTTHMHGRGCIWLYTLKQRGREFRLHVFHVYVKNRNDNCLALANQVN